MLLHIWSGCGALLNGVAVADTKPTSYFSPPESVFGAWRANIYRARQPTLPSAWRTVGWFHDWYYTSVRP